MERSFRKDKLLFTGLIIAGILVNVIPSYFLDRVGLPLFFDTSGTIFISALAGPYFGIITAVCTNFLCTLFNRQAFYFSAINALIAIYTASYLKRRSFKKAGDALFFILTAAFISGSLSALIQWGLLGQAQHSLIEDTAQAIASTSSSSYYVSLILTNFILNILDKGFSTVLVVIALRLLPKKISDRVQNSIWRQRPLSDAEKKAAKEQSRLMKHSIRARSISVLIATSAVLVIFIGFIGFRLFFESEKAEKAESAASSLAFASDFLDRSMIDAYLINGRNVPGYEETEDLLRHILQNSVGMDSLSLIDFRENGAYYIFDVAAEDGEVFQPGERVDMSSMLAPIYPYLVGGYELEPFEISTRFSWRQYIFKPIRYEDGKKTVCYAVCRISLDHLTERLRSFILKIFLTIAGLFILIIGHGLWSTGVYTTYPISTLTSYVDRFSRTGDDQEKLDENVRMIRSLDIRTDDEVELLYRTICSLTLNRAEQLRSIRRLSDSTAMMQDGLIITMADMVESRDSDTGAHVQKTAAYVKIIVEGLQKKGYYAEKISPKFISDIVRSAPLHDVGKINIPDGVLNQPRKLTNEEFEIMKTHTTAGKEIIEKAISTVRGGTYLKEARNMAAYHHERWDGKGYPEGLHGEAIPLAARIMAVADVFDALTSPRIYKPAFPLEKALAIIEEGSGTQFDPKCVEVFFEALPEVKLILRKYNQES
ncbi:MAG: HD domain-containing protein [Lachnospiraceae bacterium]|nr:HD domain-containing protein [Lachnospiraceae bacterium]